jgi:NADH:ubiquinone reductase (H+-translocating)
MADESRPRRVVIIGGGFAGLFAARSLKGRNVSVTLIDRNQYHLFQPLLYQCATGILSERKHKNVDCVMAEAADVDIQNRRVIGVRVGGDRVE